MCIQNVVKFCPFVLKILSGNEIQTSIKGCNSVTNLRKMTVHEPNLDLVNINVYTFFFVKLCPFVLKILSRKEILTSIKGRKKMMFKNPNLDHVNINVYTKFCQLLSICSQNIERNKILTSVKGCNCYKFAKKKMTFNNPNLDLVNINVFTKFGPIL